MPTIYDLQSFGTTTTLSQLGTVTETASITASGHWGNALNVPNNNDYFTYPNSLGLQTTIACGFRMFWSEMFEGIGVGPVTTIFWSFLDSGNRGVEIRHNAVGEFLIAVAGVAEYATGYIMPKSSWNYLELKVVVHNSAGTLEFRVNGGTVWSTSGIDTQHGANAYLNHYAVGNCFGSGPTDRGICRFEDIYVASDFLGDVRVQARFPNGTGNSSGLVGSDGDQLLNYALVDETAPNDDTDYVYGSIVSEQDTYLTEDVPVAGAVRGLKIKMRAKKTVAGTRSIGSVTRSDGADYAGTTQALTTSYAYYDEVQSVDPDTSAEWTDTAFDAAEFGAKVAA